MQKEISDLVNMVIEKDWLIEKYEDESESVFDENKEDLLESLEIDIDKVVKVLESQN